MDGDRRKLVRDIAYRIRGLTGTDQDSKISELCAGDETLVSEVRSILREDEEQTIVSDAPLIFAGAHDEDEEDDEQRFIGKRVGNFRVKKIIASGGMGSVYEAFQEHPKRVVALKVMKAGITSRSSLRRFEYEIQVLARLRHPSIAQVYEAGAHDEGGVRVPYFAMEYVPGAKTLTEYASSRGLSTRERLELFAQICDAVAHGHQKGVIHRDLKPSNILVDSSGQPKVIDFGVARSTDSDLSVATLQTDIGQLVGTVQYMSPEQCDADPHDLDTRSDVYALGVVLYELLTGQLPYDVRRSPIHEAVRIIKEDPAARPSAVNRTLRGDIETIALTALEKDRERRYQSAQALGEDIKRYLANKPIEATPPGALYRLGKFVRRNRVGVAAAAVVALALAGGSIGTTWAWIRAVDERNRAEREAQTALAVNEFLNDDLLAAANPENHGRRVTVREVIDIASERIGDRFEGRPLVEASVRITLGRAYHGLGEVELARPHLREAVRIREEQLGREHRETLLAQSEYVMLLDTTDEWEEASQILRDVLRIAERTAGADDPLTLQLTRQLAGVLGDQGRNEEAAVILQAVIARYDEIENPTREDRLARIEAMLTLAETSRILGDPGRAESLYETIVEAYREAYRVEHPRMLNAMNNLGLVRWEQGRLREAERVFRSTLDGRVRVLGEMHLSTARTADNLGLILSEQGRFDEAEALQRRALNTFEQILGPNNPDTIICENNLADSVLGQGRIEEAEAILADVVRRAMAALPGDHWHLGVYLKSHAETLIELGRFEEAQEALNQAYEIQLASFGAEHRRTQDVMQVFVDCYKRWGREDDAQVWVARLAGGD